VCYLQLLVIHVTNYLRQGGQCFTRRLFLYLFVAALRKDYCSDFHEYFTRDVFVDKTELF